MKSLILMKDLLSLALQGYNPLVWRVSLEGQFLWHVIKKYNVHDVIIIIDAQISQWNRIISDMMFLHRKKQLNVRVINISTEKTHDQNYRDVFTISFVGGVRENIVRGCSISDLEISDEKALFSGRFLDTGKWIAIYDQKMQTLLKQDIVPRKIQVIVTCYNEEDIIGTLIASLVAQGLHVHVIDNWSTDHSSAIVKQWEKDSALVSVEKFPREGPSDTFNLKDLLTAVQTHARHHHDEFDWFVHHDADEIREAPFKEVQSLADGIAVVDALGYNAIDHTVINFVPIPDGFDGSKSVKTFLRYFSFGNTYGDFIQIKAWKSSSHVDVITEAGHYIRCPGRTEKIFPYKFLLRHYPLRSQKHAMQKIFVDRKLRWNKKERAKDWHTHYDDIIMTQKLPTYQKEDYLFFDRKDFYKTYLIEAISGVGIPRQK